MKAVSLPFGNVRESHRHIDRRGAGVAARLGRHLGHSGRNHLPAIFIEMAWTRAQRTINDLAWSLR
jgi:hypothetical protein